MQKNQFFKGKEQTFTITKRFYIIGRQRMRDREGKIKREMEELFFKPIIVSINDVDKFEEKDNKENKAN